MWPFKKKEVRLVDVTTLTVHPGDVLVFKTDLEFPPEAVKATTEALSNHWGFRVPVIVIGQDDDVSVLRGAAEK